MPDKLNAMLQQPGAAEAWAAMTPAEQQEVMDTLYAKPKGFMDLLGQAPTMAMGGQAVNPIAEGTNLEPSTGELLTQAAMAAGGGVLGRVPGFLGKLRIAGTGKAKDAALAAKAVRGAGTALQPGDTAADLMEVMRGKTGTDAVGARKAASDAAIAQQLPPATGPVGIDTQLPAGPGPALSRENYLSRTKELSDIGNRGFNLQGMFRDSPEAVAARALHGEKLGELKGKVAQQGGEELLGQVNQGRRDFSAAKELQRGFRPNTGEGPDRVFRPQGFSLQDLQERSMKRVPEIQGRLGQSAGNEYLETLLRGGKPGTGTDHPITIPWGKFKGIGMPLGLEKLAGPAMDPLMLQQLLQSGGMGLLRALQGDVDAGGGGR